MQRSKMSVFLFSRWFFKSVKLLAIRLSPVFSRFVASLFDFTFIFERWNSNALRLLPLSLPGHHCKIAGCQRIRSIPVLVYTNAYLHRACPHIMVLSCYRLTD